MSRQNSWILSKKEWKYKTQKSKITKNKNKSEYINRCSFICLFWMGSCVEFLVTPTSTEVMIFATKSRFAWFNSGLKWSSHFCLATFFLDLIYVLVVVSIKSISTCASINVSKITYTRLYNANRQTDTKAETHTHTYTLINIHIWTDERKYYGLQHFVRMTTTGS